MLFRSVGAMVAEALVVPVPVAVIMLANGLVFGLWRGALISLAGGLIGALAAYGIGRLLGRTVLERALPAAGLRMADALMAKYGRWALVLNRWIPGVPGDPVSYAAGITKVPARLFLALTVVGLVPANLITAYLGSQAAGDVPRRYWISGLLLVGSVLVGWTLWIQHRCHRVRL